MENTYGKCNKCSNPLEPIWNIEEEHIVEGGFMTWTGRTKKVCSHLECKKCLKRHTVDDTFDGEWY